jgi:UDP-glucose 4-epimerase
MNVLIVGGAGYIGKALVASLIHAGHNVRVLDQLFPSPDQEFLKDEYICGTLLDAGILPAALDDIEAVYHLAWSFYPGEERREVEENLFGTLNLLEACKISGVRYFYFASTAAVYGPTGKKAALESDPCHPERSTIGGPFYAITKLACEQYSLAAGRNHPAVTIFRIHGVFSQDRLAQFSKMIEQANQGKDVVTVFEAGGPYAHLDDVVWAMTAILGRQQTSGKIFNLAGSRIYRDQEIADYIARKANAGSKVTVLNDPGQRMISISIDKLSKAIAYRPREYDFLKASIDLHYS